RPGHGEGDAGLGERAGDDRRPGRPPGRRDPRRRRRRPVRPAPGGGGRGRGGQDAGGEGGRDPGGVPPRRARPRPVRAARPPARTRHRVRRVLRVRRALRGAGAVSGGLRCMLMRGGTSKGAYFLADDLPSDPAERDDLLLRVMGTPDPRQIDGIAGADPLTSKVAVVSASRDPDADVDYLFLQVGVEEPTVSDGQNCGNLLAGVGPFAVERGLAAAGGDRTSVRIRMVNSGSVATATFPTPGGVVSYDGDTAVSGVPGTAAPVLLDFAETEGSACASLPPTGRPRDTIDGVEVTCVDNGMPVVVVAASDLGVTGYESPGELGALRDRVQALRLRAGELMGLGDVTAASVPKTTLVAPPREGGAIC